MSKWPDQRLLDLFGISLPILQAPMAGPSLHDMAVAVATAGGLGSLPCALLSESQVRSELELIRRVTSQPININFFCHPAPAVEEKIEIDWKKRLRTYYLELGLDPEAQVVRSNRNPFDDNMCSFVEECRPEVVSFHFGLPPEPLLKRVKATGAKIISSATTVREARWLEDRGVHAVIAQGIEAGGHRGVFLHEEIYSQVGTFALVPQIVDAVKVPVIAAGGIMDGRGIAAAFMLGASAVQIGTAYLYSPEAKISAVHRAALFSSQAETTALTNLFTGRPARGIVNRLMREIGPISPFAPNFPLAGGALAPLKIAAELSGSADFSSLWAGQGAPLGVEMGAQELTVKLATDALKLLTH